MSIFLMFGKYSSEAMKEISPDRTEKAREVIQKNGGKIISMYAVMGEHDLVLTIDFPDADKAIAHFGRFVQEPQSLSIHPRKWSKPAPTYILGIYAHRSLPDFVRRRIWCQLCFTHALLHTTIRPD